MDLDGSGDAEASKMDSPDNSVATKRTETVKKKRSRMLEAEKRVEKDAKVGSETMLKKKSSKVKALMHSIAGKGKEMEPRKSALLW